MRRSREKRRIAAWVLAMLLVLSSGMEGRLGTGVLAASEEEEIVAGETMEPYGEETLFAPEEGVAEPDVSKTTEPEVIQLEETEEAPEENVETEEEEPETTVPEEKEAEVTPEAWAEEPSAPCREPEETAEPEEEAAAAPSEPEAPSEGEEAREYEPEEKRFTAGYVWLRKGSIVYEKAKHGEELGRLKADGIVYAEVLEEQSEREEEWLKITFDTPLLREKQADFAVGYVQYKQVEELSEEETEEVIAGYSKDGTVRRENGGEICVPCVDFEERESSANEAGTAKEAVSGSSPEKENGEEENAERIEIAAETEAEAAEAEEEEKAEIIGVWYNKGIEGRPLQIHVTTGLEAQELYLYQGEEELSSWKESEADIDEYATCKEWHVSYTFEYSGEYYLWYRASADGSEMSPAYTPDPAVIERPAVIDVWYEKGIENKPLVIHATTNLEMQKLYLYLGEEELGNWNAEESEIIEYETCKEWVIEHTFTDPGAYYLWYKASKDEKELSQAYAPEAAQIERPAIIEVWYEEAEAGSPLTIHVTTNLDMQHLYMYLGEKQLGEWRADESAIAEYDTCKEWTVEYTLEDPGAYYLWYKASSDGTTVELPFAPEPLFVEKAELKAPVMTSAKQKNMSAVLYWEPVQGADGYEVCMYDYGQDAMIAIGETEGTTEFLTEPLAVGEDGYTEYTFCVRAWSWVDSEKVYSAKYSNRKWVRIEAGILTVDDFQYERTEDGTGIVITRYVGRSENVTVPSTIEGIQVTEIDSWLFEDCTNLQTVKLPNSLENISWRMFAGCENLQAIDLPASVTEIETGAFGNCDNLQEINVATDNECFTVENGVLYTKNMKTLVLYPCIKERHSYTVPNSVETIAGFAINYDCTALDSITIPASVTAIRNSSIYGNNISELDVGAEEGSEAYAWALRQCIFTEETVIESEHPCSGYGTETWKYTHPEETYALSITFSAVTEVEDYWESITITTEEGTGITYTGKELAGKTIDIIGDAFSITLKKDSSWGGDLYDHEGMRFGEYWGFRITKVAGMNREEYEQKHDALQFMTKELADNTIEIIGYTGEESKVVIPGTIDGKTVTSIGYRAFYENTAIVSVTIPDSMVNIEQEAFRDCTLLQNINYPVNWLSAGENIFRGCTSLESIIVPEGVTEIPDYAFCGMTSLKRIELPSTLIKIGEGAFEHCSLESIDLPEGLTEIDRYAFAYCTSLESLYLPNSITTIEGHAFEGCTNLSSVNYPMGWKRSDYYGSTPFYECPLLTEIIVPEGITEIPAYAFYGMTSLKRIELPSTLTKIGEGAFGCCPLESIELPEGVTEISAYAFYEMTSLKRIELPSTLIKIGEGAFEHCSLESIDLPEGLTELGELAFFRCTGLTRVVVPQKITQIGESTFSGCSALTSVSLPEGLTEIGYRAFADCTSLESLYLPNSITTMYSDVFDGCTNLSSVNYPLGWMTKPSYSFSGGHGLEPFTAYDTPFSGCPKLTSIVVPEGVTEIPAYAFYGMTSLQIVDLPSTLTKIGNNAFNSCTALENVKLPDGVMTIEDYAFTDCASLTAMYVGPNVVTFGESVFANHAENFTIYGESGAYAENYAAEQGLIFSTEEK